MPRAIHGIRRGRRTCSSPRQKLAPVRMKSSLCCESAGSSRTLTHPSIAPFNVSPKSKIAFSLAGVLLFLGACLWLRHLARKPFPWEASDPRPDPFQERAESLRPLEAREKQADNTIWAKEKLAQNCGRRFEALWDSLKASTNKLSLIAEFPAS